MALVESWARGLEVKGALEEKLSEWHRAEMEVELDMDVEHHEDIGEEHA